ncbi:MULTISPECIES: sulfite exporter TauE/SafE family protein [unclassified Vibrio]|uniref:sulfite exporter TauE/SafE family protein n=1 Tax=unclassified Vibrio TaxID=2614977 RepID=UPI0035515ED5
MPNMFVAFATLCFNLSGIKWFGVIMDWIMLILNLDSLLKLALGGVIGFCLGMTGVGGGVLIIPILQVVFGMGTVLAVGTASLISALVKVGAGISHISAGNVAWRPVAFMLLGAVPSTLLITELILRINSDEAHSVMLHQVIDWMIIGVMLFSLLSLYLGKRKNSEAIASDIKKRKAVCTGAGCGAVLGSTGVGGGVMLLPAFNSFLGVDIKKSIGSSVVMALALSSITALNYSKGGQADWTTAGLMTFGALLGVPLAVRIVKKIEEKYLYTLTLGVILFALALTLLF